MHEFQITTARARATCHYGNVLKADDSRELSDARVFRLAQECESRLRVEMFIIIDMICWVGGLYNISYA